MSKPTHSYESDSGVNAVAELLATTDLSHRSHVRSTLRQNLIEKQPVPKGQMLMNTRIWKPALSAVVVSLILAVLLIPSVQSFAQSFIKQIGSYNFSNNTQHIEPAQGFDPNAPTATPIDPNTVPNASNFNMDERHYVIYGEDSGNITGATGYANIDEAEAKDITNFDVIRHASNVPERYVWKGNEAVASSTFAQYSEVYKNPSNDLYSLNIFQLRDTQTEDVNVGPQAEFIETSVNGLPATLILNADSSYYDIEGYVELYSIWLIWEDGNYTFSIIGFDLSQDEMLAVAESMYN